MYDDISPMYMLELSIKIKDKMIKKYKDPDIIKAYLEKLQNARYADFVIYNRMNRMLGEVVDLLKTLIHMDNEFIFKIAVEFDVKVSGLIYLIPEIKDITLERYPNIKGRFEAAVKEVFNNPSHAIVLANATLETVIKEICKNENIEDCKSNASLYDLSQHILKQFDYFPNKELDQNIRNIGSGFLRITQSLENIRSNNTNESHGKLEEDYIIEDPLYASMFVNSVTTLGLFLLDFYEKKYGTISNLSADSLKEELPPTSIPNNDLDDDVPF